MRYLILVLVIFMSIGVKEMECSDDLYDFDYSWDLFDEECDE